MPRLSRYLSIECEWTDHALAADPLERQTWSRIQISAGGRSVSRVWDREAQSERASLYLSAFPIACWIVQNWWVLLYEPARTDKVPPPTDFVIASHRAWLFRHCLRSAEAGLMLPRMCMYADGRGVGVNWSADDIDAYPHMPGQFVESGSVHMPTLEASEALHAFVSSVVARIANSTDDRANRLRESWTAIATADSEEEAFCRSAGRLGLDPYRSAKWDPALATLLETGLGTERPIVVDFLEASETASAPEVWKWISGAEQSANLQKSPRIKAPPLPSGSNPAMTGYVLATKVRALADIPEKPLSDLKIAGEALGLGNVTLEQQNHLSSTSIRAAVGWRAGKTPVVTGPVPARESSARFLHARGLYHAAYACEEGARLITDAHTWDQQASRAFAAELLAPQAALVARLESATKGQDSDDVIRSLAKEYRVGELVVEHQLANAGISLGDI